MHATAPTSAETLLEMARMAQGTFENSRLRAQAACVRTLCDEIKRHECSGRLFAALCNQLEDEVAILGDLVKEAAMPPPLESGVWNTRQAQAR